MLALMRDVGRSPKYFHELVSRMTNWKFLTTKYKPKKQVRIILYHRKKIKIKRTKYPKSDYKALIHNQVDINS